MSKPQPVHLQPRPRRPLRNRLLHLMRLVHIGTAMLGLLLMLFFSATGFLLHHRSLLGRQPPRVYNSTVLVPSFLLRGTDKQALTDFFRKQYGAVGKVNKFEFSDNPIHLAFVAGSHRLDVTIDPATGKASLKRQLPSLMNRFLELHRAQFGGRFWGYFLDATTILIFLISLTGIIIWLPLKRWRMLGLITLALGVVACLIVYFAFIPL